MDWNAQWIWAEHEGNTRNVYYRFRRSFRWDGQDAMLHITADSRYDLYVNGEFIGQGPARGWPQYYPYDTYNVSPYLAAGENTIAVRVNHYGEGNFQYIHGPAGLLAQLEDADGRICVITDETWLCSLDSAMEQTVPRISVQLPFEEQVDGRLLVGWITADYDDSGWEPAVVVGPARMPPRTRLVARGIPFLTREAVSPARVVRIEAVKPARYIWTIPLKPYLAPKDLTSNRPFYHAYLYTRVHVPAMSSGYIVWPHLNPLQCKINGIDMPEAVAWRPDEQRNAIPITLSAGWNTLLLRVRGGRHHTEAVFLFDVDEPLRFAVKGEQGGGPWAVVGPFGLSYDELTRARTSIDKNVVMCHPMHDEATAEAGDGIWESGAMPDNVTAAPYFQPVRPEHLPAVNVYATAYSDEVKHLGTDIRVENTSALLSQSHEWTIVHPAPDGNDVRLLLDFGKGVLGCHRFELDAPAGTVVDWHNFEFIQPDGRHNLAEGMNNSFRYITRDGRQQFESRIRRGFQYSWLMLRHMTGPVKIRFVDVIQTTYPQSNRGSFQCSDDLLDRIWQIGKDTLRCCAEDTYTDCPTYEQTHWVGDARNEALIDWVVNGDSRLWYHCLEQAGQSLDRSPLVESHVPSAWQNILPAWSFLWMRSCREYALFTGDTARADQLLHYVARNIEGIKNHLNDDGLFSIQAWNMFDWAAMDVPNVGVVTHQNCLAVQALREAAALASWRHKATWAHDWNKLANELASAINDHLWNEQIKAYTDCLRDGQHSAVYSQQTQTAAYVSGVAQGERADRCFSLIMDPPAEFIKAGSPFFAFFLLEALQEKADERAFLDLIRRDWGFMVDQGATTFWEMWSQTLPGGRLTRSHCHGWSGAPTFFLSTHVLGVQPLSMGFKRVRIRPHPGDLTWCRGHVPTPAGIIEVQWEKTASGMLHIAVSAPDALAVEFDMPPAEAEIWLNGERVLPPTA